MLIVFRHSKMYVDWCIVLPMRKGFVRYNYETGEILQMHVIVANMIQDRRERRSLGCYFKKSKNELTLQ